MYYTIPVRNITKPEEDKFNAAKKKSPKYLLSSVVNYINI